MWLLDGENCCWHAHMLTHTTSTHNTNTHVHKLIHPSPPPRLRQQCIQTRSVINPAKWHAEEVTRELVKEEMNVPHKKDVPHHQATLKLQ